MELHRRLLQHLHHGGSHTFVIGQSVSLRGSFATLCSDRFAQAAVKQRLCSAHRAPLPHTPHMHRWLYSASGSMSPSARDEFSSRTLSVQQTMTPWSCSRPGHWHLSHLTTVTRRLW
jgi:hypothetical protein